MAKTHEQPDEPHAAETAAELARIKEQAQGFGQGIGGLEKLEQAKKIPLQSVLRNLSEDELIKRTISVAMKDPETMGKVSKKITEATKPVPVTRVVREKPLKKTTPTFSKYAADSGEDMLTMARHVARSKEKREVHSRPQPTAPAKTTPQELSAYDRLMAGIPEPAKAELSDYDRLMAGLPSVTKEAETAAPKVSVPRGKIKIPVAQASAVRETAPASPPPLISPEAAPQTPEGANRLDSPAFAEWFSSIENVKAGNPAEIEKFFGAFEIKEQVKEETLKVWKERVLKESWLEVTDADLALVANQLEVLAKREPEKFVALYGETVKNFREMPAEISRLEGELGQVDKRTIEERRPELAAEEKKLELARASNRFLTGFGGGWGRLTGVMARLSGSETLKAQAEARKEVRSEGRYRTIAGGVSSGGFSEKFLGAKGGVVGRRLSEIGKEYADAVGKNHTDRAQVEIALARAKKGFQGARAGVFAEVAVQKEMSEFLSAKVAETVKQITTPGQITTLEDWMKADDWLSGLAERAIDENKLADYLAGVPLKEIQAIIGVGIRDALEVATGEVITRSLEHPENPGRATELFTALDGAFGELLTKKKMGVLEGDKVIEEVVWYLAKKENEILFDAEAGARLKAAYIQSARARLWAKYRSPVTPVASAPAPAPRAPKPKVEAAPTAPAPESTLAIPPPPAPEAPLTEAELVREVEEAGLVPPVESVSEKTENKAEQKETLSTPEKIGDFFTKFCKTEKLEPSLLKFATQLSTEMPGAQVEVIYRPSGATELDIYFTRIRESSPQRYWLITLGTQKFLLPTPLAFQRNFEGYDGFEGAHDLTPESLTKIIPVEIVEKGSRLEIKTQGSLA